MKSSKHNYENLVFEGGGVKGAVYAGAIQVMDEHQLLMPVKRVAGTSAGSITAAILAVGGGSKGLTETIVNSNFSQFIEDRWGLIGDAWRLFRCYGIHTGDNFSKILKGYIKQFGGKEDLTFAELEQKRKLDPNKYKHLSIVTSNITTQEAKVFNVEWTPNVPIWKAVRCSMSIPVIFEPFEIDGDYFVDGGLSWNYPIDIFDEKKPNGEDIRNMKTLGFYIEPHQLMGNPGFKPAKADIHSLKSAMEAMIGLFYNTSNSKHFHPGDKARTVFIDDLGVSATDWDISKKKIDGLIASGRKATEAFLK